MFSRKTDWLSPTIALLLTSLAGCSGTNDISSPKIVTEEESAGSTIALDFFPLDVTANLDTSHLYITNNDDNEIIIYDTERQVVIDRIEGMSFPADDTGCPDNLCRGRGAADIALNEKESLAVASSMTPDSVSVIDLTSQKITKTIPVERFPRDIALSQDDSTAYVYNGVVDTISIIDVAKGEAVGEAISMGGDPRFPLAFGRELSMWLSPDDSHLYAFNTYGSEIVSIDTATREKTSVISLDDGLKNVAISTDGKKVALVENQGITVRDANTLDIEHELSFCHHNNDSMNDAISNDGRYLALSIKGAHRVQLVDLQEGKIIGSYKSDDFSSKLIFSADNTKIYVLDFEGNITTLEVMKSAPALKWESNVFCTLGKE